MASWLEKMVLRLSARGPSGADPPPLLVELLHPPEGGLPPSYRARPFAYRLSRSEGRPLYEVWTTLPEPEVLALRLAAQRAALELEPSDVVPLTFERLIEVLSLRCASHLGGAVSDPRLLSELGAYDAVGMSRVLALAKDERVTEVFVDSDSSPVYLDHAEAGRCETDILLTERERKALETHLDTFRGYSADYASPSLKNDLLVSGARMRVSIDLPPVAVNRFSLDMRRLNLSTLSLKELIARNVLSTDAGSLLLGWLEAGGNVAIVGETGTGKTTLLNALDVELDPRLRRVYIEDAVETRELLESGYHQVKVKVDPLDRGGSERTKETEIVKALHRSPDLLILSEIQSQEHSSAFFHALSAGIRGIQTFHASSVENALRRWENIHHIPVQSMVDLGVVVQMSRPERLKPERYVQRVCEVTVDTGGPRVRELFLRDRDFRLRAAAYPAYPLPPTGTQRGRLESLVRGSESRLLGGVRK